MTSDAVYVVEFRNISQGLGVLDEMFKCTSLVLLHANPICIGKYLICVGGDVADVREAQNVAENDADGAPMASYMLLGAHPSILAYFKTPSKATEATPQPDALGIFETYNASSGFMSLDSALKFANVQLARVWLGQFLGGKFCYVLAGSTSDVQSGINAASRAIEPKELAGSRIISGPEANTLDLFKLNN